MIALTVAIIQIISVNLIQYHNDQNRVIKTDTENAAGIWLQEIDEWCMFDNFCGCVNPLEPHDKHTFEWWNKSMDFNLELIQNATSDLDVVILGDSITEQWNGRKNGTQKDDLIEIKKKFDGFFHKEQGGKVDGLALGIAGDASSNLLYRLKNGEMPKSLNPKVWWLLIGTNDISDLECVEEIIELGIIRVVEEILYQKPNSTVVINGILPRTDSKDGYLITSNDKESNNEEEASFDLWPSIEVINKKLQHFAAKIDNVKYVDSSDLFLGHLGNDFYKGQEKVVMKGLMEDYFHPSAPGYELWGKYIVNHTLALSKRSNYN